MAKDLDPTEFTDREQRIAREGYRRGYVAAERFWRKRLLDARKDLKLIIETLEGKQ